MVASQRRADWSKRPVPDAIDTLVRSSPKRRSPRYSPKDMKRRTARYTSGAWSRSHQSRAGRYEVWSRQPARAWYAFSSTRARSASTAPALRVSAHE